MRVERILVAIDFSAQSDAAIEWAFTLARAFEAHLTLFHVYELPTLLSPIVPHVDDARDLEDERRSALERLARIQTQLIERDSRLLDRTVIVATEAAGGTPAEAILERASVGEFDVIVMGTHGRSGLRRLLVGSVAETVIRHANVPVVTTH